MTSQEQFLTTFSLPYEFCQIIITLNFLTLTIKHIQVLSDDVCRVEKCYKHKTHPSDQNIIERNDMCFFAEAIPEMKKKKMIILTDVQKLKKKNGT